MAKEPDDDYYKLLGVDEHVDDQELRRVWRKLAHEWHPDRAGPGTTVMFQRISKAYAVLSDPVKRAGYDRKRGTPRKRAEAEAIRRAPSVMIRRLSAPLNALLARGVAEIVDDEMIDLFLEPHEAAEGGMITISMRVPVHDGERTTEELYSAWLAVRPGTIDGTILTPSARLPGMIHPVVFRVRLG
jgi:curved DNA-binding protein CbpA